jgi:starch phosphorylase
MKFMLNGAVTLGTEDGANVEIRDLVGNDNIYIFGKKKDEVIRLYAESGYHPDEYYKDPEIKKLIDFITGPEIMANGGNRENLERLHHELITKDWFMTLLDLKEYIEVKEKVYKDYEDRKRWNQIALVNIAKAGFFSSDRTIKQYNDEIWHLK